MRPRLILMQGKPGCGKSYIADALYRRDEDSVVVSSDEFLWEDGQYIWTKERGMAAHQRAQEITEQHMREAAPTIIIDNTNLKYAWAEYYINLAYRYGYDIQVIRVDTTWNLQRNQNDQREGTRRIPLEHFRDIYPDDLLLTLQGQSLWERWRVLWSLLCSLFLQRQERKRIISGKSFIP